jgi:glycosyltransferase involved in cell wall biosynthesis
MAGKNSKIKVLFTIPNFNTAGSGKALFKIANGLDKDKFEVHIACFHEKGEFFKTVKASGIPVHVIQLTHPFDNRLKGVLHSIRVARFFRRNNFDIIHSYHYASDYSEPLAAKIAGVKWVYTKKNMNWGGASKNSWKLRSFLADAIAYQNSDMKKLFFSTTDKTFYLPRGVDTVEFKPGKPDLSLLKEMGIGGDEKIVLCVANLVPVKGVETLIDAFVTVKKQVGNSRLIIVGDNKSDYGKQLMSYARNKQEDSIIIFTGKRSDINRFLSVANLFVLPTLNEGRMEGSPVALLEAMASGIPVIASKIPGIKDQLSGFDELMFTPGNVSELTKKLIWGLNLNHEQKTDIVRLLRNRIIERYTIEKEIERHENLYLTLMKR